MGRFYLCGTNVLSADVMECVCVYFVCTLNAMMRRSHVYSRVKKKDGLFHLGWVDPLNSIPKKQERIISFALKEVVLSFLVLFLLASKTSFV